MTSRLVALLLILALAPALAACGKKGPLEKPSNVGKTDGSKDTLGRPEGPMSGDLPSADPEGPVNPADPYLEY